MVEHSPTSMHTGAFVLYTHIITHVLVPMEVMIWGLKDLNVAILK
jgi:hypothetical protein